MKMWVGELFKQTLSWLCCCVVWNEFIGRDRRKIMMIAAFNDDVVKNRAKLMMLRLTQY